MRPVRGTPEVTLTREYQVIPLRLPDDQRQRNPEGFTQIDETGPLIESVYQLAPQAQSDAAACKRKKVAAVNSRHLSTDTVAALLITRPHGLPRIRDLDYKTYVLNPSMVYEWLGNEPLTRLMTSLEAQPQRPPLFMPYKQITGVYGFSVDNFHGKAVAEQGGLGSTVMTWTDHQSGTSFNVFSSTWG
jgi:hypothetical protein